MITIGNKIIRNLGSKFLILYGKIFKENKEAPNSTSKKFRKLTVRFVHSVAHGIAIDYLGTETYAKLPLKILRFFLR